jgi:4a-hydroxytetrahydrobiopterin dehydratase
MAAKAPLSDIEVQREIGSLSGWTRKGAAITKTFSFPSFPAGIEWVRRVADLAELRDHHPDLDIRYTRITVTLSTHSAGGITAKDFELARGIDSLQ